MKALEFDTQLANHDQIRVPAELADQIQLSLDRFAAAYSEEDAVYEKMEYGLPVR
jgi:hypothetical protein